MNAKSSTVGVKAGSSVIRLLQGAEETDRLTRKHLPAWVASGGVHLTFILLAWLILGTARPDASASIDVINTTVEKPEEQPVKDLTQEEIGLESNLSHTIDVDKIAERTVDAAVTTDPIGVPDTKLDSANAVPLPGLNPALTNPGVDGRDGNLMSGIGGPGGFAIAAFDGRGGATKVRLLQDGGNTESEAAVARGLAWLAAQQKPDGGWTFDGTAAANRTAATGMALLPFLAAGETHKTGKKYREVVFKGLNFLINNMNSNGSFNKIGGGMYSHGIATIALCEAYGMTRDQALLLRPCRAAIGLIQRVQHTEGGWRYPEAPTPGDLSVVGWQVQALQAARLGKDIPVDDKVVQLTNRFLDKVSGGSRKATYGYVDGPGQKGTAMTAVGLLCRYYFSGWGPTNGGMSEGVEGLMTRVPKPGLKDKPARMTDLYFYYYATQVVHFYGGKEWRDWNEGPLENGKRNGGMRDWLIWLQVKAGKDGGSWDPDQGSIGGSGGRLGTTCLSILTLEVYYRHLPLFKREGAGGGEALK